MTLRLWEFEIMGKGKEHSAKCSHYLITHNLVKAEGRSGEETLGGV